MTGLAIVDNGMEMPSYNVRHSIATKVAAKKTAKGYTLSDENCTLCEMPLMTMNGKSECKVCPAIKKWLQRKMEAGAQKEQVEEDAREEVETMEKVDAEVRDEASVGATDNEVRCEDDIAGIEEKPDEKVVADDCSEQPDAKATDSNESTEVASKGSDDSGDDDNLARRLENMNVYNSESTDESAFLSRSESEESEDTEAIRRRARQIIMQARGKGEWGTSEVEDDDDDDEASINSPNLSTFSSESIDVVPGGRTQAIINRALRNVNMEESTSFEEPNPNMGAESKEDKDASEERIEEASSDNLEPQDVYNSEDWERSDVAEDRVQIDPEGAAPGPADIGGDDLGANSLDVELGDMGQDVAHDEEQDVVQDVQENEVSREEDQADELNVEQEDEAKDVAQEVVDVLVQDDIQENNQDTTDPNSPEKDTCNAGSQELVPVVEDSSFLEPPQQQDVPMSDNANTVTPARGIFAQLACKFDDAVTDAIGRVHSIVTCANTETNGGYEGGFEEAFEAEQYQHNMQVDPHNIAAAALPAGHGQVKYDALSPRQAKYEAQTVLLKLQGWQVANVACRDCKRSMMFRPEDGHMICADCDTVQPQAPAVHHPSQGYAQHPMSVTNHAVSSQLYDMEINSRLQMGWVAMNYGCPYCNSQLMRQPNEDVDQCLACGPIFDQQPMQAGMPMMNQVVPGMAYTPMGMGGHQAVALGTPNASFCAPPPPPPINPPPALTQSFDPREECAPTPKEAEAIVPPQNQMMQSTPTASFLQSDDDTKENESHQANVSRQLDDTKTRIEDAKKFIMSRNARRSNPNLPPLAQNRAPAMQTAPFGQQMSMMTPGSRVSVPFSRQTSLAAPSPLGQRTTIDQNAQPQVSMMTPGSQAGSVYHNKLTEMGSLMSPESDTNEHHPENLAGGDTDQVDKMRLLSPENEENNVEEVVSTASNGTKNSGYRTPQMPGKFFFA